MENYTLVPRFALIDDNISDKAFRIYCLLQDFAFNNVFSFPSIETMAEKLGKSEVTVKRGVKELREHGLVKIFREHERANNVYVLIPMEFDKSGDGYIDTKEEFDDLIEKVKEHYEEQGRKVIIKKKQTRGKKNTKSKTDYLKEIDEKINKGDYTFSSRELCYLFEWANKEIRQHSFNINWGRDINALNSTFGIKDSYGKFEVEMILKYVSSYDNLFKTPKYQHPTLWGLSRSWQYDKIKSLVEEEMRAEATDNEEMSGEVF